MTPKEMLETAERPKLARSPFSLPFSLSEAKLGDRLQIVALTGNESSDRLRGMGLIPGAAVEIMSLTAPGSVVVALHHQRLGLGTELAQRVQVVRAVEASDPVETNALVRLQDLPVGSVARVTGYQATARPYRRKLLAMGLTKGTEFTVVRRAPLGDPIEIRVRGFSLSLRKDEANALLASPAEMVITGENPHA